MTRLPPSRSYLVFDRGGTTTKSFIWTPKDKKRPIRKISKIKTQIGSQENLRAFILSSKRKSPNLPILVGSRGVYAIHEKKTLLKKLGPGLNKAVVLSDLELAYLINFDNRPGLVLSVATGSALFGRLKAGTVFRAGGLGPLLGDEGSAFWFGREKLKVLARSAQGRRLARLYATNENPVQAIALYGGRAYQSGWFKKSREGKRIFKEGVQSLVDLLATASKGTNQTIPIALRGGLLEKRSLRNALIAGARKRGIKNPIQKTIY